MQLSPNSIFDMHYTLIRQLGLGGFSEVWLAHDSYMDLDVALKIYAPGKGMEESSIDEFRHEIKDVFDLNHSNLLKPQYLGVFDKMPYLVLSYCRDGSMSRKIGKMSEQQIWKLIHDVASGLAYLHSNDIVHQDIKPDNILLDSRGNYVISDFGISAKARSTLRQSIAGGGVSGGTMAYMGPERFSKQPAPTKASDIWSFGAMVYELITGNLPFGEMGGGMQKNGAEIPEITEPISDDLRNTVESMLALNPWDRPTAESLASPSNHDAMGRATQRQVNGGAGDGISANKSKSKTKNVGSGVKVAIWAICLLLAAIVVAVVIVYTGSDASSSQSNFVDIDNEAVEEVQVIEEVEEDIDRVRIERLIASICRNSSKGGDYNALQGYFASSIYPHPSGETRYNYNIGEQTKNYVERFNEYEISSPFNFTYSGTSFPLTVKCDISATWTLKDGTSKRAWIHKTYFVNSEYKVTGYTDEEYNREVLQSSPFASGYSLKADVYYRIVFDVNSTLPVYSNESCSGQPSFYLYKGSSFVVLHSRKVLYSAEQLTITRVIGKAFPDCVDNGYNAGDKLYVLESVEDGQNIVLNGTREEYACFSIQGNKAVTRYDGCNMIEGDISGYEKSIVTMQIKVTKNGTGTGFVRFEYDGKTMKSDWGSVSTYWNKDYNS